MTKLFSEEDDELVSHVPVDSAKMRTMHCYASDIKAALETELFESYTKFCIVRNPFDRMVSWYFRFKNGFQSDAYPTRGFSFMVHHLLNKKNMPKKYWLRKYWAYFSRLIQGGAVNTEKELSSREQLVGSKLMYEVAEKAKTFEDFIALPDKYNNPMFERFCTDQLDYISEDQKIIVDRVLRFEELPRDFNLLAKDIGMNGRLPHVNASRESTGGYRDYYSERSKDIITKRFQRDLGYFNYQY